MYDTLFMIQYGKGSIKRSEWWGKNGLRKDMGSGQGLKEEVQVKKGKVEEEAGQGVKEEPVVSFFLLASQ